MTATDEPTFFADVRLDTAFPRVIAAVQPHFDAISMDALGQVADPAVSAATLDPAAGQTLMRELARRALVMVLDDRIDDLVPAATKWSGEELRMKELPTRLRNRLQLRGLTRWGQVAPLTPGEVLAWPNAGVLTSSDLLAAAMIRAISHEHAGDMEPSALRDLTFDQAKRALVEIAAWVSSLSNGRNWLDMVAEVRNGGDAPPMVLDALSVLEGIDLASLVGSESHRYDPVEQINALLMQFKERDIAIFDRRALQIGPTPTLEEVGEEFDLTRQRIRQIEAKVLTDLTTSLQDPRHQQIADRLDALGAELGVAWPLDRLPSNLKAAAAGKGDIASRFMLWSAGPYVVNDSWLVRRRPTDLGGLVRAELGDISSDRIIGLELALKAMERLGFRGPTGEEWLERDPQLHVTADAVVLWVGSLVDKIETLLRMQGSPMSWDELFNALRDHGEDPSERSVRQRVFEDERFIRRGRDRIGLAEWGGDEYTTIVDAIVTELDDRGGEASIDEVTAAVLSKFPEVSRNSVTTYIRSALFVRTGEGRFRVRLADDPLETRGSIETARACYLVGGRWAFRVTINAEHLRGSGSQVPTKFAMQIGLRPSAQVSTKYGQFDLTFTWRAQPTVSSLRPVIEHLGGSEGDLLFISMDPSGNAHVHLVRMTDLAVASPSDQLLMQLGERPGAAAPLTAAARALGLPQPDAATVDDVMARLQQKGDDELMDLAELSDNTAVSEDQDSSRALLQELLSGAEGDNLELKQTLSLNLHTEKRDPAVEHACLKTIAGFMNASGGTLLIGVADDLQITGIEVDLALLNKDLDRYELHFRSLLTREFGEATVATQISIRFHRVEEGTVVEVEVLPSPDPAYIADPKSQAPALYVRAGNQTMSLSIEEAVKYVSRRFSGQHATEGMLSDTSTADSTNLMATLATETE